MAQQPSLLPIEKLLLQSRNHHEDSWLLPYLDIFILLTMMFIVLLSMSSTQLADKETLLSEHKETIESLEQEIEPLRQLEMEGRSALMLQHWQERIHQVLDSLKLRDDIALTLDDQFIALQIQDQMLFDSGRAELKPEGQAVLDKLLPLLNMAAGIILVEGHTDNLPISTAQFPSNWELGAARASNVVKYLVSKGMAPGRLRATSYADTKPIADNATEAGRQKNRRVTLLLRMPDTE
jgi:chemotaxis protein MotB